MDLVLLIVGMIVLGAVVGALAGVIWKGERPYGALGDYGLAILVAVVIGLVDWFVIPAMNFSDTVKYLGVATEPLLGALAVLWLLRRARRTAPGR
jgi:uncharacterized membrane protein YeaQ/YmgE (transglycosylase-associated protein family)